MKDNSEAGQSGSADATDAQIMSVDEAAAFLRMDRKTVYDLLKRNQLPGGRRFGNRYRIRRDVLLESFRGQALTSRWR